MSASLNKDKSSSDYHSVVEQTGIKAGTGGFDITVTGMVLAFLEMTR
ncbi:hypothetical protein GCM10023260_08180 [Bartonella acomydis]|uniref:Uncharacterized protein n=1 Tax=Bartonella acomydis TaxID=686234 RepID=A0ABP9MNI2_9HYPH